MSLINLLIRPGMAVSKPARKQPGGVCYKADVWLAGDNAVTVRASGSRSVRKGWPYRALQRLVPARCRCSIFISGLSSRDVPVVRGGCECFKWQGCDQQEVFNICNVGRKIGPGFKLPPSPNRSNACCLTTF